MSFILDALRKSEHERRRGALPSVAQIPYALPRARLPVWVPVAIGALAVALVVTGFTWWYTAHPAADAPRLAATAATPQGGALPVEPPLPRAAESTPSPSVPEQAPAWTSPPRSPQTAELRAQVVASSDSINLAEPAPQSAVSRAALPAPQDDDSLPRASALAAVGAAPPLTLHLLVYDDDAAKRFVIINNRRYSEGAFLTEGPQLMRISNRGAILRQQGRDFLLLPE